jgi:hypothetical protein
MDLAPWLLVAVIGMLVVVVAMYLASRKRAEAAKARRLLRNLDPVVAWPPEATRILTPHERSAYLAIVRALPDHVVFAQVPLARFLKVPRRHSYAEWINRVGQLSADLVVCDKASQPLIVVEVHSPNDSPRSQQRHDLMARVLKAAKIRCIVWVEGFIPTHEKALEQLTAQLPQVQQPTTTGPVPPISSGARPGLATIPVPEAEEVEEEGPLAEPMRSTWFDELESARTPLDEKPPQR